RGGGEGLRRRGAGGEGGGPGGKGGEVGGVVGGGRRGGGELLVPDPLLQTGEPEPAVLPGPRDASPAVVEELALPLPVEPGCGGAVRRAGVGRGISAEPLPRPLAGNEPPRRVLHVHAAGAPRPASRSRRRSPPLP